PVRSAGGAPGRRGVRGGGGRRGHRRVWRGAGTHHPRRLAGADRLPGGRAAHAGRARYPRHQRAGHHRAHRRQALDHGAARAIGAIERTPSGCKCNLGRGGRARSVTWTAERTELALAAARAVAADYAGVDLLPARDGTVYVVEVNGIPGWRGLQEATSLDVAAAIVELLIGRVARQ